MPETKNVEIKNRWRDEVLYTAQVPADMPSGMMMRVALEQAATDRADLRDAYLGGAYLGGAYLGGADLRGAYLGDTYLGGADLRDAYLRGAYLRGAYLGGADLRGAYLGGACLGDDLKLVGDRPVLMIDPIGSESRTIFAYVTDKGLYIKAGCFFGTRDEFAEKLIETHAGNGHEKEYTAALVLMDAHFEIWNETEKEAK